MKKLLQSKLQPQVIKQIQEITLFREKWQSSMLAQKDFCAHLRADALVSAAGSSTRIEGSTLSDEGIRQKLIDMQFAGAHSRDEAKVAGYIDCKRLIFDSYRELAISEYTVQMLHQKMLAHLPEEVYPKAHRGAYKDAPNSLARIELHDLTHEVTLETTEPGEQTEQAMRELMEDYRYFISSGMYSDLEVIAAFIVKFLAIHPFSDGNGRMSHLLTDLCLLQQGYHFCMYAACEKVIEDSKLQYYVALRQTQSQLAKEPDINPWFSYFLKVIEAQVQSLRQYATAPRVHIPVGIGRLTEKEAAVVSLMKAHQEVTIGFLERETGFKRVTLKSILHRLKDREMIVMEGQKKTSRYQLR